MNGFLDATKIADQIEALCKVRNVSIRQMLSDCNLGKSVVDNMKKGSLPTTEKVATIANYFGVSIDELLGNEQKNKPSTEVKGLSADAVKLLERTDRLSPANRAKLSELIDLFLNSQDNK